MESRRYSGYSGLAEPWVGVYGGDKKAGEMRGSVQAAARRASLLVSVIPKALAAVLVCLFAVAIGAGPTVAEDPGVEAMAVRYYVMENDVSEKEALQHIRLQAAVMPSMDKLASVLGDRYGGAYFDPKDEGRLKIAVVGREAAASQNAVSEVRELLRANGTLADADFVDATTSYDELVSASQQVARELSSKPDSDMPPVGVDVRTNSVVVTASKNSADVRQDRIEQARQAVDVPVLTKVVSGKITPRTRCSGPSPLSPFCDRPLRGGVEIQRGGAGSCTAGFNVTSRSDGKRYVLTAGHCGANASWSTKTNLYGQWNEIGPEHNFQFYYRGRDAGIIRDKVPSYWQQSPFPGSTIWFDDIPGVIPQNTSYHIGQEPVSVAGTIVCATGGGGYGDYPYDSDRHQFWHGTAWASYTWCGTVTVPSETVVFGGDPAQTVYNMVRTNLCFWGGMSGGPVFMSNMAYGTISGDACASGYQWGWYYPAWLAENDLNVSIVH